MPAFLSDGVTIAYESYGDGAPVVLIHGFASSGIVNWVQTGWVEALTAAGFRAITMDNRGHGLSEKIHDPEAYHPATMAGDAARLMDHLGIAAAPVVGYSMGARIAAFLALAHHERVACAVWGGMGLNLVAGLSDSEEIIAALTAPSLADVTGRTGRQFRIFADHTGSDRLALAACMVTSREPMSEADVRRITAPVLVVAGSEDTMAGAPQLLADLLPRGESVVVPRRDHMRTTGDTEFKRAGLEFLARNASVGTGT